jgi:zinc protease
MSVFTTLYRKHFTYLLLIIWLMTVFLLNDESADSQLSTPNRANEHQIVVSKKITPFSVTENVSKTVLENGLTVLTKEVHTAPVVTVQMWYKVGSRNEEPGVNGIAHQLEHMMFKGTINRPIQFGRLFSALGSDSNAFTSYDQTVYYNVAERDKLQALLVLEADRMGNALIDAVELNNEKRVVISELQGYENSPEYRLNRAVMRALFPNHAYGLPVGGVAEDVEKFQVEQVKKYYRNFYSPNNAVLVIVGDFQTQPTLTAVKEIFEKIPPQETLHVTSLQQHQTPNTKPQTPIILTEPGATPLFQAMYPLPDINHPDVPALDVMDYILTEGRNSRLYQAFVESGLASDVTASVYNLLEGGWYEVLVIGNNNQDLPKIDSVFNTEITRLVQKGVSVEEVKRAKKQLEATVILSSRNITNFAMQLGHNETTAGDYGYIERYLAGVRKVVPADIKRVAQKYLKQEARIVGFFKPTQIQAQENHSQTNTTQISEKFSTDTKVDIQEVSDYLPPVDLKNISVEQALPQQFTLSNGLRILLLPDTATPTITLSAYIKAGTEFDPEDKAGLASLVAESLMSGTQTNDELTLAKVLSNRGATLDFEAYREGVHIEGNSLAPDLPILIQTLADVLKNPKFPAKNLELSRKHALASLKQDLDDPSEVAERTFVQSVYPKKHPLHTFPTQQSLQQLHRKDVIAFHKKHYRPDNTVLTLIGDFIPSQVRLLIETEFGKWPSQGKPPILEYPMVQLPEKVVHLNPNLPGKSQAITYMGNTGINRKDPRFYAALVLNQILGGDTISSRLGAEVRDRQGLTYGIFSNFLAGKNFGTFLIEMQTNPEDTNKAIASTRQLLQQIHQYGVTREEVETAKRTLISNYTVSLANPEDLAYTILMNEVYGLEQEELGSFSQKIQRVTLTEVNQAAHQLLNPDKIVVVTAGPAVSPD